MLKNRKVFFALVPLIFGALIFGVVELFQLRFEAGDVYPAYSSLRTDPLGTKALYEGFDRLPGLAMKRLYEPVYKLSSGQETTLFVLGVNAMELKWTSEKEAADLEKFMRSGGRLVVSFIPENAKTWSTAHKERQAAEKREKTKAKKKKTDDEDESEIDMISLEERWGLKTKYAPLTLDEKGTSEAVEVTKDNASKELPDELSWHTALCFEGLNDEWTSVYQRDKDAVMIERSFGKGTLVMVSDSYLFSNEALRNEREASLLSWMAGPNSKLIFDETHLGVTEDPGIAALIRKYRLHGLVAGLVLLVALFLWKNATSFVPARTERATEGEDAVTGKDSIAGFVNLLRRSISPADILSVCFTEWKKSYAQNRSYLRPKIERVQKLVEDEAALPPRERNPAQSYHAIAKILADRK